MFRLVLMVRGVSYSLYTKVPLQWLRFSVPDVNLKFNEFLLLPFNQPKLGNGFQGLFQPVGVNHVKIFLKLLGLKVCVPITFKRWRTFLFSCCVEQYKLVHWSIFKQFHGLNSCRKACGDYNMSLLPVDSVEDISTIIQDPNYRGRSITVTNAVEVVDISGSSTFFSKPGGKQVDVIQYSEYLTQGRWNVLGPRTYGVVIHWHKFYNEDYFSNARFQHKNITCACKLSGKWCLYIRRPFFWCQEKKTAKSDVIEHCWSEFVLAKTQ